MGEAYKLMLSSRFVTWIGLRANFLATGDDTACLRLLSRLHDVGSMLLSDRRKDELYWGNVFITKPICHGASSAQNPGPSK